MRKVSGTKSRRGVEKTPSSGIPSEVKKQSFPTRTPCSNVPGSGGADEGIIGGHRAGAERPGRLFSNLGQGGLGAEEGLDSFGMRRVRVAQPDQAGWAIADFHGDVVGQVRTEARRQEAAVIQVLEMRPMARAGPGPGAAVMYGPSH